MTGVEVSYGFVDAGGALCQFVQSGVGLSKPRGEEFYGFNVLRLAVEIRFHSGVVLFEIVEMCLKCLARG